MAEKLANATGKLIVMDFWAIWCGPCKTMDSKLWETEAMNEVKDKFVDALKKQIEKFYGPTIEESPDLARITTRKHYQALKEMITGETLLFGGKHNDKTQYIEPTIIDEPGLDSKVMQGEIFGPLLPIISYDSEDEIGRTLLNYEKPLSLYVFSTRKKFQQKIINTYGFGGGCIDIHHEHLTVGCALF